MRASSALVRNANGTAALDAALDRVRDHLSSGASIDLVLLFASARFEEQLPEMVARAQVATGARLLAGCTGQGIIGDTSEIEDEPALSLLVLTLPGARLVPLHCDQGMLEEGQEPAVWYDRAHVGPDDLNAWLLFADPFTIDTEELVSRLSAAYPGIPIVGGLASGEFGARETGVFLDGRVETTGAVAVGLGGAFTIETIISQGCQPIGETWTITGSRGHLIESISSRPAYEVLLDTFQTLPPEVQERAQSNLLVGLVVDEYRDEFKRGDFLIRNLMGADPQTGALAVGAVPRTGQTIQFQLRDADAADEDLRELLARAREQLAGERPLAALLCSCNGRGTGLFGTPDHDARALARDLGPIPVAGFFCNGEIGPIGSGNYLHGFTAAIGLLVPKR